jgi:cardiolipin synthase C
MSERSRIGLLPEYGCGARYHALMSSVSSRPQPQIPDRTRLDRLIEPQLQAHPGQSAVRLLPDGVDAFTLRVHTLRAAERSIDLQYYIWHSDATGRFLTHELLLAADRGVHVRVLLDDMDARSRDSLLVALDRHPRVEIRLFNPFATRSGLWRTLKEVFVQGSRLNRRMHNKSWIVDRQLAIVGGRNIGDEYFAASEALNFLDMDVLLAGPAVEQAARSFARYWNNAASVPIARLRRTGKNRYKLGELRRTLRDTATLGLQAALAEHLRDSSQLEDLLEGDRHLAWSQHVQVVADDPCKANRGHRKLAPGVLDSMIEALGSAQSEVLLISPYFVPGAGGTAALRSLVQRDVRVAVLTNSLSATDVAAVHSGYARYRRSLLEGGVQLHELKAAVLPSEQDKRLRLGSSRASLHTKSAIIDRRRIFVGSFNLDPRSAELNCEMGVWLEEPALAAQMLEMFAAATAPVHSYHLTLDPDGRTCWSEETGGQTLQYRKDPHAGPWRRLLTWVLQLLPLESQL